MKKLYFLLIGILALTGCTKSSGKKIGENGLEYTLSESKDSYIVTGIGTCKEKDIIIPSTFKNLPVTGIDDFAFMNCNTITSIEIPSSVTSIGRSAFFYCNSLTSVEFPNSVTNIGETAFYMCTSLTSIIIPNSVTSIGKTAFYNYSLTIYCEASSKPIGWNEYWNCIDLVDNSLSRQVYWGINENNYLEQDGLIYVLEDENAVLAGHRGNITDVIIPSTIALKKTEYNVSSIGYRSFSGCSLLSSIEIPNSITSIGDSAFSNCSSLTIYCEASSKPISWDNDWNDYECPVYWGINDNNYLVHNGLIYVVIDGNAVITGHKANNSDIVIPSTISMNENKYSVTSIGKSAFSNCDSLISITIPNSVKSIGETAFYMCTSLTSIVIPNSVTNIEERAFYKCISLTFYCQTSCEPSGWSSNWNHYSWYESDRPVYWEINENNYLEQDGIIYVVKDGKAIVTGHKASISDVVIPSTITIHDIEYNVTSVGEKSFYFCDSLTSINLPSGLTSIGQQAFSGCDSLTSIVIPNSVSSIGSSAFVGCNSLTGNEYENCIYLGDEGNPYLVLLKAKNILVKKVKISEDTRFIMEFAFMYCNRLTSITIPNKVTSIRSNTFNDCKFLSSVILPDSITCIGYGAFSDCIYLTSIVIPSSVTKIENSAFSNCKSLTSVVIPSSVTDIEKFAFSGCDYLTIYCEATSQPSGWDEYWNNSKRPVYWAEQWSYVNDLPVLSN